MNFFLRRQSSFLVLLILSVCCRPSHAGFFSNLANSVSSLFGSAAEEEDDSTAATKPLFYREDTLGTAAMMLDFIMTPMYFVALFKYRDQAVYEDGRETNATGFDADRIYTKVILSEILPEVGGELVFIGNVEATVNPIDFSQEQYWDAMAILYFPNSFAFARMAADDRFQELTPHKKAGLKDTLVFSCEEVQGFTSSGGSSSSTNTTNSSSNNATEDLPVTTATFYGYKHLRSGPATMEQYYDAATTMAYDHYGMRMAMELDVKQTLIRTDLDYQYLRIETWPNRSALDNFRTEMQGRPELQGTLQESVEDATSLQVSPMFINSLGGIGMIGFYEACASTASFDDSSSNNDVPDPSAYCP